jgi:hypothetical protein
MNQLYCLQGAAKHPNKDFFHHSDVSSQTGNDAFTYSSDLARAYHEAGGKSQICNDGGEQDLLC